jgi:phytoene dehydrogenase-like protein
MGPTSEYGKRGYVFMKKDFDVIIVGGGPGGLTIGSLLAREGISPVILEKEPALGGRYRSVDFEGSRVDNCIHLPTGMVSSPEETYMYKFLDYMGIAPEPKVVEWKMGLTSKDNPNRIDYLPMDPKKGVENFFEFFAFGGGVPMEDVTRQALSAAFKVMEDMSDEECRRLVDVPFASWIENSVEDPMAKVVLELSAPLMGAAGKDVNFGQFANIFGTFPRVGAILFWYPKRGNMESMVVTPLAQYCRDHGATLLTNRRVRSILIEGEEARGVLVHNSETGLLEEYRAPVVICAVPIFQAVSTNVLSSEFLTKDWAEAVKRCGNLAIEDLAGFYLLSKEIVPREGSGWIHLFDADFGIPTYVGDVFVGSMYNAVDPPGKQVIFSYISGGTEDTHFGLTSPLQMVNKAKQRWKDAVEKAYPGFVESIEHEEMSLNLNWGRYAYAVVPTEIDIQSPNIRGLYFAGDTIWSVSSMVSDKIYQMVFPLCERVLEYVRS